MNQPIPPSWYPDPGDPSGALRYWDGRQWTIWQARHGIATEVPLTPEAVAAAQEARRDHRAPWPGPAAAVGLLGLAASALLAVGAVAIARGLGLRTLAEQLVASSTGLYVGLIATCRIVQRRWGTGAGFRRDFGVEVRRVDVGPGVLGSLVARGIAAAAAIVVVILLSEVRSSHYELTTRAGLDWTAVAVFSVIAVVAAPVVEELFFRGLILRSLETVLPSWGAIAVQGGAFGLAHATVDRGVANLFVIIPIGLTGMVLGWLAHRYQRLGPGMVAHACFNALPVTVLILRQALG